MKYYSQKTQIFAVEWSLSKLIIIRQNISGLGQKPLITINLLRNDSNHLQKRSDSNRILSDKYLKMCSLLIWACHGLSCVIIDVLDLHGILWLRYYVSGCRITIAIDWKNKSQKNYCFFQIIIKWCYVKANRSYRSHCALPIGYWN